MRCFALLTAALRVRVFGLSVHSCLLWQCDNYRLIQHTQLTVYRGYSNRESRSTQHRGASSAQVDEGRGCRRFKVCARVTMSNIASEKRPVHSELFLTARLLVLKLGSRRQALLPVRSRAVYTSMDASALVLSTSRDKEHQVISSSRLIVLRRVWDLFVLYRLDGFLISCWASELVGFLST